MGSFIMKFALQELEALINSIQAEYTAITNEWENKSKTAINLKHTTVSDIDETIYNNILDYVQLLNDKIINIFMRLSSTCSYQVTVRVKTQNSIEYKIQNYKTEKHGFGKIPINKCINDLLGIRIFLEEALTFDEISSFIKDVYQNKYKHIDSSKQGYKAVHVYFKKDNRTFQWELQVWNCCDKENNLSSHEKYKQQYTYWEEENKRGGFIDG